MAYGFNTTDTNVDIQYGESLSEPTVLILKNSGFSIIPSGYMKYTSYDTTNITREEVMCGDITCLFCNGDGNPGFKPIFGDINVGTGVEPFCNGGEFD